MKYSYKINISEAILDDLKKRLAITRWPDQIDNLKWETGTNMSYLKELCDYWQNGFDWKLQEDYLNSFYHFKSEIDGINIHFIYEKGSGKNSIPLLLTHGYPDSFVRFMKVISLLTRADENDFSFDVIIPSIPGFGFSDIPKEPGMDKKRIADLFVQLMRDELGYERFVAHGGDWGSQISEQIALYHPKTLIGLHLTDIPFEHALAEYKDLSGTEKRYLEATKRWQMTEGAYSMIQSTKPQTLSYGLNDSPAGLAGWIIEKFHSWSDCEGDIETCFTKDELLTNLTIYWATQSINSANHLYYETMRSMMQSLYNPLVKLNPFDKTGKKSFVPAAFAIFPYDISNPPKEFAERFFKVDRWKLMSEGGHFAAMEKPKLLAEDIRNFVMDLLVNEFQSVQYQR